MGDFELSYREVIPDLTNAQVRKDIIINTGLYILGYVLNETNIFFGREFSILQLIFIVFLLFFKNGKFYGSKGAAQSTLQDIKVIEKAGGYCYSDLSHESKRNRFIYWYVEIRPIFIIFLSILFLSKPNEKKPNLVMLYRPNHVVIFANIVINFS